MLGVLAILGLTVAACAAGRRFERALAPAWCLWSLLLTALAAVGALETSEWVAAGVLAALLGMLLVALARGRGKRLLRSLRQNLLTPGLACFALVAAYLWYACGSLGVWWGDDVYYWALMPKQLWQLGALPGAAETLSPLFGTYTPGMALMQWQAMKALGEWRESLLYFTLFLSCTAFLLPLCERVDWRRWYLAPVCAVGLIALPMLCNMLSYSFLSVDTALAACFAFALVEIRDGKSRASLALTLCGLALLKQSGVLLCALALGYALCLRRGRRSLCWLAPAAVYGGWMLRCHFAGLTGLHTGTTAGALGAMLSGGWVAPAHAERLLPTLWAALCGVAEPENLITSLPVLALPKLFWLLLLPAVPLALGLTGAAERKPALRTAAFMLASELIYLAVIALSMVTTFADELEVYTRDGGNNLILLMMRYLAPLTLGFGTLDILLLTDFPALRRASRALPPVAAAGLVACLALCTPWGALCDNLWPDRYLQRDAVLPTVDKTAESNFWADGLENVENAVVLIDYSDDAQYLEDLIYTFAPARILKAHSGCGDAGVLAEYLAEHGVTHVVCLDDQCPLYAGAAALCEDGWLDTYSLYEVAWEDGEPTLCYF